MPSSATPRAVRLLCAGIMVNRLGMLTPPFLVLYLLHLDKGGTAVAAGVAACGVGQTVCSLAGGVLADRFGNRLTILVTQAAGAVSGLVLIWSRDTVVLTALVFLSAAFGSGHRPAAFSMVAGLVPATGRAKAFGWLYWSRNVGSSLSPLAAGSVLEFWPPGIFALGVLSSLVYLALATGLPDEPSAASPSSISDTGRPKGVLSPFRTPMVAWFLTASLVLSCIYMQKQGALPLDMSDRGLSPSLLGLVLSLSGVLVVVLQPVLTPVVASMAPGVAFGSSAALIAVGFGMNTWIETALWYAVSVVVWTIGEIMQVPLAANFMAERSPAGAVATYQGAYNFMWNLGLVVGGPLGQLVYLQAGRVVLWAGAGLIGGAVAITNLIVFSRSR